MCPSPRPDIFPKGTPHAATIGPTASEVLSPTPPVECLSTTRRPERGPEVDRLAGLDHRVGEGVRLSTGEALEVDGHAPGRHLVVGHVATRVAEDELGDLLIGQLPAVPLALDRARPRGSRVPFGRRSCAAWRPGEEKRPSRRSCPMEVDNCSPALATARSGGRAGACRAPCRPARRSPSRPRPRTRPPRGCGRQRSTGRVREHSVLARVIGGLGRRVAAVVGGDDQEVAGLQRLEDVGSRRSKSCRQRWKFTGSLRCPHSMSVSTRFTKTKPPVDRSRAARSSG